MKTAVEWLFDCIPTDLLTDDYIQAIFKHAKEIEKEQRQEDTNYGYSQGWDDGNQNKEPMRPGLKKQEHETKPRRT
jgi:hypothetical protein